MAIRKKVSARPQISAVQPEAAITGGELYIRGKGLAKVDRPKVLIGDVSAPIVIGSDALVIVKVPEGASAGDLTVESANQISDVWSCDIGIPMAENLHPVGSPAVDSLGNVYTTFSGSRGQKVPVAVYRIDLNFNMRPFVSDMMNATAIAIGRDGLVYISSRFDGMVYQVTPSGSMSVFVEGMGIATGMTFDEEDNLYVGDRSGDVEQYFRGLGRPQGMAFDVDGNLYSAASHAGRKGVVKITPDREVTHFVSGPGIVGLAFSPSRAMIISTTNAIYRVDVGVKGYRID